MELTIEEIKNMLSQAFSDGYDFCNDIDIIGVLHSPDYTCKCEESINKILSRNIPSCFGCEIGFILEYEAGYGWYHCNTNGGPDLQCTNPSVTTLPNPEDEGEGND